MKKYGVPVLLKGGHLAGDQAIDLLFLRGKRYRILRAIFSRNCDARNRLHLFRRDHRRPRERLPLEEAVRRAKKFVTAAIAQHHAWDAIHALNQSPH